MNFSRIQYIALDLDETLLQTDKSVSDRTRAALETAQTRGLTPIIATARPPRKVVELLGDYLSDVPRIYYSGSLAYIGSDCIHRLTIPLEAAMATLDQLIDNAPNTKVSIEIDDRFYCTHPHGNALPGDVLDPRTVLDRGEPVKIMCDMKAPDLPDDILEGLPNQVRYVLSDGGNLAQIMQADVSKADGVRRIVEALGGTLDEVIAFGDDTNDIEMIRDAEIGIAMANAVEPVKAVADRVTASHDEDGVAIVLEELLEKTI